MTTIVLNTLTGAVSEHALPYTGISAGFACSASGLYAIGGATDDGTAINARAVLPITDLGSNMRKGLRDVFFAIQGPKGSKGTLIVQTMAVDDSDTEVVEEFAYPFPLRANVSRGLPGRGIRANRIGLGFANVDGADFRLKEIEVEVAESKTRRLA